MFNINTELMYHWLAKTCMPVPLPHRQCLYIKVKYPITPKHTDTLRHTYNVRSFVFYLFVYASGVPGTSQHLHQVFVNGLASEERLLAVTDRRVGGLIEVCMG